VFFGHYPGGSSIFTWEYFKQLLESNGVFKDFDHGTAKNLEFYGQPTPPLIDMQKISVPTLMFVGRHDTIVHPHDSQWVRDNIPTVIGYREIDGGH